MDDRHTEPDDRTAAQRRQRELGAAFMAIYGNPELSSDPRTVYRRYREQGATVRMGPLVMTTDRELCSAALRLPTTLSSGMDSAQLGNTRPLIPMQLDPPDHAMFRRVLDPLFSRKGLAGFDTAVTAVAAELVERVVDRGHCDFTSEIATPLPATILLRLLGLPDADRALLIRAKDGVVHPPRHDMAEAMRVQHAAGQQLYAYFEAAVAAKRATPGDDLLTRLTRTDVDGRPLTTDEIVDMCYLLVLAGLDTITDSMTLMWAHLARHPEHRRRIATDPAVIPTAIEELLRWESPIPGVPRIAREDVELGGCPVRAGDIVYVALGSANGDPQYLPDADVVDLDRSPNRHLAFGGGIHHCLGSYLAKLQIGAALAEWHRRIPEYTVEAGAELRYTPGLRSVEYLPLRFPALVGAGTAAAATPEGAQA